MVSETDPNNPYGPNYYFLPRQSKVYYKYLRLSKFVHLDKKDEEALLNFNYIFYGGVILSIAAGYFLSKGLMVGIVPRFAPRVYMGWSSGSKFMMNGLMGSLFGSLAYFKLNNYYSNNYIEVLTNKYIDRAIENGFVDYKISEDK